MTRTSFGTHVLVGLLLAASHASAQEDDGDDVVMTRQQPAKDDAERLLEEFRAGGNAVAGAGGDAYVVQPGDTLWDICQRFFSDPQYWPTLWSINGAEITNPHYIYPGQVLRFRPGTDTRPPSLIAGPAQAFADLSLDDNFVPLVNVFETERDCAVHIPFRSELGGDQTLAAPVIAARSEITPLGAVDQAPDDKTLLGRGDTVYMRFGNTSDVNCGDVYTLYRPLGEIRHPESKSARLGHSYQVTGEVLITDVGERWVTGRLVNSYAEVQRGSLITDRIPVVGKVRPLEVESEMDGFIVQKPNVDHPLAQRNEVVFIDRGRSDGIRSGSTFWIVRRGDGLETKERRIDQTLPDQVVGRLVVFSADEHVATAVVTDQALEVRVGDRITAKID